VSQENSNTATCSLSIAQNLASILEQPAIDIEITAGTVSVETKQSWNIYTPIQCLILIECSQIRIFHDQSCFKCVMKQMFTTSHIVDDVIDLLRECKQNKIHCNRNIFVKVYIFKIIFKIISEVPSHNQLWLVWKVFLATVFSTSENTEMLKNIW